MAASDALGPNPIYVEVGGNIGTCVMEMLLATDAHVVVFEPLPKNVALLAQTLLLNEASLRNRVKLYPIALGDYPRKSIVTRRKNNSANSIVGESGVNIPRDQASDPVPVAVDTLDAIFSQVILESSPTNIADAISIPLMKVFVSGGECKVLEGGVRVFGAVKNLRIKFKKRLLDAQKCSMKGAEAKMAEMKFEMLERDEENVYYRARGGKKRLR